MFMHLLVQKVISDNTYKGSFAVLQIIWNINKYVMQIYTHLYFFFNNF